MIDGLSFFVGYAAGFATIPIAVGGLSVIFYFWVTKPLEKADR